MPNTITHNRYQPDPCDVKGPYVHHVGPHQFEAYRDGWFTGRTERTYSAAAKWLFPGNSHGYPIAYYPETDDGDLVGVILCADCAAKEWIADPTAQFHAEMCEEQLEADVTCDNCSSTIAPQQCRLCFDSIHEAPWHRRDYPRLPIFQGDYYVAHGECIAKAMTTQDPYDPSPTKVGKQAYRVPAAGNQIMRGPHAIEEDYARAIASAYRPTLTGDYVNAFTNETYLEGRN